MSGFNRVIICGHIGKEIDLRYTADGRACANFSVATTENWTGKDGKKNSITEWNKISSFGKQAEIIAQYFHNGDQILVEGKLRTRSWDDKSGKKVYQTEIILESFSFVGSAKKSENKNDSDVPQLTLDDVNQGNATFTSMDIPF